MLDRAPYETKPSRYGEFDFSTLTLSKPAQKVKRVTEPKPAKSPRGWVPFWVVSLLAASGWAVALAM